MRAPIPSLLATWCFLGTLLGAPWSSAQGNTVPVEVQAALVTKIMPYDRNFAARARGLVRVAVVVKPGSAESVRFAAQIRAALTDIDAVGGLPHEDERVDFDGAAALAAYARARGLSIVYLGPGLESDIEAIRAALDGLSVLSVAATADYVPHGIVLGFALEGAKTKLLFNIRQARKQGIAFDPEVVRLLRVYE